MQKKKNLNTLLTFGLLVLAAIAVNGIMYLIQANTIAVTGSAPGSVGRDVEEIVVPPLEDFVEKVANGDPTLMVGIYSEGLFADVITHQPAGNFGYVDAKPGDVTLFHLAEENKTLGLLAHNYLAGHDFFKLEIGDEIHLILGDGSTLPFRVAELHQFQALQPNDAHSQFLNLETGVKEDSSQVFQEMYDREYQMVLQTCIDKDGNSEWGRLFVISEPILEEIDLTAEEADQLH